MHNCDIINKMVVRIMVKWIARAISTLAVAFFLMMVIGEYSFNQGNIGIEGTLVAIGAGLLAISVLIAWIKPKIGGVILIICSLIFMAFIYLTSGSNRIMASVIISSPFLISGILFFIHGKFVYQKNKY